MRQIWITKPGDVSVLQIRESEHPVPGQDDVLIEVKAIGINFADIMARIGMYFDAPPTPCVVGYEVSGIVEEVGAQVTNIKAGDRVMAITHFGGDTTKACVPSSQVWPMPPEMTFEEGAALLVNYLTAYLAVFTVGNLKKGERILVHSAGGGVGIAAIQLAKTLEVDIFGTANKGKHEFLRGIGVREPIDYLSTDFSVAILRLTDQKGVHLILDPIGGASIKKDARLLAPLGRIIVYGISSSARKHRKSRLSLLSLLLSTPRFSPLGLQRHNHGIFGLYLGALWEESGLLRGIMEHLKELWDAGAIRPRVARAFAFEEVGKAHTYIQERRNIGKVVLRAG